MEYKILEYCSTFELTSAINAAVDDGWIVYGFIVIHRELTTNTAWYVQMVYRRKSNDSNIA